MLYLGKAGLWLMLLDKPRVGDHNATGAGNATRARDTVRWSPGSVHFSQIFMGMVVLLMTALGVTLCCRAPCCSR